jgi:hypothetical protein
MSRPPRSSSAGGSLVLTGKGRPACPGRVVRPWSAVGQRTSLRTRHRPHGTCEPHEEAMTLAVRAPVRVDARLSRWLWLVKWLLVMGLDP